MGLMVNHLDRHLVFFIFDFELKLIKINHYFSRRHAIPISILTAWIIVYNRDSVSKQSTAEEVGTDCFRMKNKACLMCFELFLIVT